MRSSTPTERWRSPKVVDAPTPFPSSSRRSIDATNRHSYTNLPGPLTPKSVAASRAAQSSPVAATIDALTRSGKKRYSVAPSLAAGETVSVPSSPVEAAASPRTGRRLSVNQVPTAATPTRSGSPALPMTPSPRREVSQRRPLSRDARPNTSLTPEGSSKLISAYCVEVGRGRGHSPSHRNHVVTVGSSPTAAGSSPVVTSKTAAEPQRPTRLFWKNAETSADSERGHWKPVMTKRCTSPHNPTLVGVMSPADMPRTKPHRVIPPYGTEP